MTEMQKAADIQSVASSLAKHGGAFFSAVYGLEVVKATDTFSVCSFNRRR